MENGKDYNFFADAGQMVVSSDLTSSIKDGDQIPFHIPISLLG